MQQYIRLTQRRGNPVIWAGSLDFLTDRVFQNRLRNTKKPRNMRELVRALNRTADTWEMFSVSSANQATEHGWTVIAEED